MAGGIIVTPPAVEDDVSFNFRVTLQLNGEIVQTSFLILTANVTKFIEQPCFRLSKSGVDANDCYAADNNERQKLSHIFYPPMLRSQLTQGITGEHQRLRMKSLLMASPAHPLVR